MEMNLENDEIIIWESPSHMIIDGAVVNGGIIITSKRLVFFQKDRKRFFGTNGKVNDIWELGLNRILGVSRFEKSNIDYPMIRIHYKEDDVFFTFPDYKEKPTLSAMIIFINHARLIDRIMGVMKNIDGNLKEGNLQTGEKVPELMFETPLRADEECHQCGKPLMEEDIDKLSEDIKECLSCVK
jgi:hypothetical protein